MESRYFIAVRVLFDELGAAKLNYFRIIVPRKKTCNNLK